MTDIATVIRVEETDHAFRQRPGAQHPPSRSARRDARLPGTDLGTLRSELRITVDVPVFHTCRCLLNSAIDFLNGHPADGQPAPSPASAGRGGVSPATVDLDWAKPSDAQNFEITGHGRELAWEVEKPASDGTATVYRGRVIAYGDSRCTHLHSILTVDGAESDAGEQDLCRMHRALTGGIKAGIERASPIPQSPAHLDAGAR